MPFTRPLTIAVLLFASCGYRVSPDELADIPTIPEDTHIELRRFPCEGTCPTYTVTVDAAGNVLFTGKERIAAIGERRRKIAPGKVLEILHAAGRLGFLDIDKAALDRTCRNPATHGASPRTMITANGRTNTVDNYHGCNDRVPRRPDARPDPRAHKGLRPGLRALEDLIDEILADPEWIEPRRENGEPLYESNF